MNKMQARLRRGKKTKAIIAKSELPRLVVFRSGKNIYAQVVTKSENGDKVISAASSLEKLDKSNTAKGKSESKEEAKTKNTKEKNTPTKTEIATQVGQQVAERALKNGIKQVAFDRNGYMYHGRVKALAESARTAGLIF